MKKVLVIILCCILLILLLQSQDILKNSIRQIITNYIDLSRNAQYEAVFPFCGEDRFAYCLNGRREQSKVEQSYPYVIDRIDTYIINDIRIQYNSAVVHFSYHYYYEGYNDKNEIKTAGSIVENAQIEMQQKDGLWIITNYYESP